MSVRLSGVTIKSAKVALLKGSTSLGSTIVGTPGGFLDVETLTSAGEYALVVDPQTSYTGAITLTLYDVPADLGGPIAPDGSAVVLALGTPGQNARLSFDGLAGDRFAVKVGSGLPGSAYVSIVGPTGATVGSRTLVGSSGGLLDLRTLELSGRHELLVDPQGAATASLTVNLYAVPPDLSPAIVPGGPPVTISTTAPGQNARLTFEGTAGRAISLQLSNVSVASAYVSVLAPDGSALVKNTLLDTSGTFVDTKLLPASGTYSIVVDPTGANTGSVTLALYDVPADVSGELVVGGPPLAVALGTPGQNARLTFQGTAGRRVSLVLSASLDLVVPGDDPATERHDARRRHRQPDRENGDARPQRDGHVRRPARPARGGDRWHDLPAVVEPRPLSRRARCRRPVPSLDRLERARAGRDTESRRPRRRCAA